MFKNRELDAAKTKEQQLWLWGAAAPRLLLVLHRRCSIVAATSAHGVLVNLWCCYFSSYLSCSLSPSGAANAPAATPARSVKTGQIYNVVVLFCHLLATFLKQTPQQL